MASPAHAVRVPTVTDCPRCRFPVLDAGDDHCPFCGVNTRRPAHAPLLVTREQRLLAAGLVLFAAVAFVAIGAALLAG